MVINYNLNILEELETMNDRYKGRQTTVDPTIEEKLFYMVKPENVKYWLNRDVDVIGPFWTVNTLTVTPAKWDQLFSVNPPNGQSVDSCINKHSNCQDEQDELPRMGATDDWSQVGTSGKEHHGFCPLRAR